jgi:mRNA-degrading endonuclease HigB of HigAB toxin-antitoxin module
VDEAAAQHKSVRNAHRKYEQAEIDLQAKVDAISRLKHRAPRKVVKEEVKDQPIQQQPRKY